MRKLSFVGMGYVGLCTAVCFANKEFKTIVSTKNPEKAEMVNKEYPPSTNPNSKNYWKKP